VIDLAEAQMTRLKIVVHSTEPMTQVSLTSYLRSRPEVQVLEKAEAEQSDVAILSTEKLTPDVMNRLREMSAQYPVPTVLVANELADAPLLSVVECGVVAILPRSTATGDQLVDGIMTAAAGRAVMPRDTLSRLLKRVETLQREVLAPNGINVAGLEPREMDVLRLLAEGMGTEEIATELRYSERTVKSVIYNLTTRLKLRNRAHAVAYALRAGVI
jgi:DNA-binding NarL/FixJ family response regulator